MDLCGGIHSRTDAPEHGQLAGVRPEGTDRERPRAVSLDPVRAEEPERIGFLGADQIFKFVLQSAGNGRFPAGCFVRLGHALPGTPAFPRAPILLERGAQRQISRCVCYLHFGPLRGACDGPDLGPAYQRVLCWRNVNPIVTTAPLGTDVPLWNRVPLSINGSGEHPRSSSLNSRPTVVCKPCPARTRHLVRSRLVRRTR